MTCDWPDFFPEGIPPDEAIEASGAMFRLVDDCPPTESDFASSIEENPSREFGDKLWQAFGVSMYKDQIEAEKTRARYAPLRSKKIARGELSGKQGVKMHTPSRTSKSHHTIWLVKESNVHSAFECIET